jgi:hypothetical protein
MQVGKWLDLNGWVASTARLTAPRKLKTSPSALESAKPPATASAMLQQSTAQDQTC